MSDLLDLKFFIGSLIRPLIKEAVDEALAGKNFTTPTAPDSEPYGDFRWLQGTCPGVPASTLRIKSAAGEIPGTVKFGKRVLYEKVQVLDWLRSKTRQLAPDAAEVEQNAETQVSTRIAARRQSATSTRKAA